MTDQEDPIRQFVIFAHFNLEGVQATLAEHPDWLNLEYDWGGESGTETPLGAAAHVGNAAIARYLIEQGAPITPAAAAMLGDQPALDAFIDLDPANANFIGAHGIPLLPHAAFSGNPALLDHLLSRGTRPDGLSSAMLNAATYGHIDVVRWALDHGADPAAQNYQGKTAADIARENGFDDIAALFSA